MFPVPAFTSDLYRRLPAEKDDPKAASALLGEVQKQAHTLMKYADKTNAGMLGDRAMEHEGTNLWNLCTRLTRDVADGTAKNVPGSLKLVLGSRVLAFHVLHLCQWSTEQPPHVACHLMRLALKVAKCCIGKSLGTYLPYVLEGVRSPHPVAPKHCIADCGCSTQRR